MGTVQQNGRFTLFSSTFPSNIFSILYDLLILYLSIISMYIQTFRTIGVIISDSTYLIHNYIKAISD